MIEFKPDPTLFPFESKWFESSAGTMHYIDEGSGTPIIFCHGNPTWSFLYRGIVSRLQDRFRCIAIDYLGFELSEHPKSYGYTIEEHSRTTGELVDHLGLNDFIVMGQDWGGPVSMAVATQRADRMPLSITRTPAARPSTSRPARCYTKSGHMTAADLDRASRERTSGTTTRSG